MLLSRDDGNDRLQKQFHHDGMRLLRLLLPIDDDKLTKNGQSLSVRVAECDFEMFEALR
jgi:hypothetical protein